ncbi:MAG: hypothetical protein MR991_06580 [Clostridiales bacterium]|nr:hypothetical protein [Clostridiales bacterium]MDD7034831.1 hypothetical protein [Bacillota bacterium]MDY2919768.1 hypothetical protein [Lentihominibacter sp.]
MKCGIKFCGGCNPRYDRGAAGREIRSRLENEDIEFVNATEDEKLDNLLVIGGCSACCASCSQYDVNDETFKMWEENHIDKIVELLRRKCL